MPKMELVCGDSFDWKVVGRKFVLGLTNALAARISVPFSRMRGKQG